MYPRLKSVVKRLPGVTFANRILRERLLYAHHKPTRESAEQIFTRIYSTNRWLGSASLSGPGSDHDQTETLVRELSRLLGELRISLLLDVPCGDFHWMRNVELRDVKYVGVDIVEEVIQGNRRYERENISFRRADLLTDPLPRADMILCRDCLVHFSFADIFRALTNLRESGSELLLATTFPGTHKNRDIATGEWRPLNLERPPFNFPKALRLINEGCTLANRAYRDKSLGLWEVGRVVAERKGLADVG